MTDEQKTERLIEHTAQIAKATADIRELFHRVEALEHCTEEGSEQMTGIIAENREQFSRSLVLENQSQEIKSLADSTHEIALSLRTIDGKVDDIDGRVEDIENDRKEKSRVVWQIILSAVLGGGLTFAVTKLIGG